METLRELLETFGAAGATRNAAMVLLHRQAEEDAVDALLLRLDGVLVRLEVAPAA